MDTRKLAPLIDHTCLKEDASERDILDFCSAAQLHGFAGVCVRPKWVPVAARALENSPPKVISVLAFPAGTQDPSLTEKVAHQALQEGALELDLVMNYPAFIKGETAEVSGQIERIAKLARSGGALLKVILETGALNKEQVVQACKMVVSGGAHFVKTSTGFGPGSATVEVVRLMRETVGPNFGVKASGGIRSLATAVAMVEAGANRIGTSSGVAIVSENLTDSPAFAKNTRWPGESSGSY